ncbi:hypothetical protein Fot_07197 [Forsythia ovata]|uniref:Uncharacterized protein n=1 Tax=Forsythia ovata TaxID=205694 RepID=A0ABD1WY10_9LAMI
MNAKPLYERACHQTGHRQGGHQRPFLGIESSHASKITEAIPNLHAMVHNPNQGVPTREARSKKSKKPFTGPYCAYHRFYGYWTEDCHDIQTLAEQRTKKKDHLSFGGNRGRNNSLFRSNEPRRGQR